MIFYQDLSKNVLTAGCIRVGRLRVRGEKCQSSGYYLLFFKNHKLIHCILKSPLAQVQVNDWFSSLPMKTPSTFLYSHRHLSFLLLETCLSYSPSLWNFYLLEGRAWHHALLSKSSLWGENVDHKSSRAVDFEIKIERHCSHFTMWMCIKSSHCTLKIYKIIFVIILNKVRGGRRDIETQEMFLSNFCLCHKCQKLLDDLRIY